MLVQKKMKGNMLVREMGNSHAERESDGQVRGPSKTKQLASYTGTSRCLAKIPDLGFHDIFQVFLTNSPLCLSEFE